ncbi:hypothetical protein [Halalkalicoccus subterraneus]|uniref:hypothetical protein n=1 Tax=Halalkalicoccus subterraneus TaxID=2675002 RepID=UPI001FE2487C|nr:hypothetical protein [Halalkalicoccus subterraneus]
MTRRSVLAAVSVAATAITPGLGGSRSGTVEPATAERSFDPTRHGFGFYNWRTQKGPYPETDGEFEEGWRDSFVRVFDRPLDELPAGLLDRLEHHAREGLLEAARTNGYCYGLIFAAQRYFEAPETIPGGFETAAEITHPRAPLTTPETPVLDEIKEYHTSQYVDLDAWLGRYDLLDPTLIDYEAQLADLLAAVDAFGTAGITVFRTGTLRSHQLLVYDYDRRPGRTVLSAYNPNYTAEMYERFTYTFEIDTSGDDPVPQPIEYGIPYDQFVYNDRDREIRARRERSGRFGRDGSLYDRLFGTTLFVSPGTELDALVVDPEGRPLSRTTGDDPLHYRYGAPEGTYTIALTGRAATRYTVDVYANSRHDAALDETIEGSIAGGETDRYRVRIDSGEAILEPGTTSAAALGVVGGYAYHRRDSS